MRLYVAGPMTGYEDYNFPEFNRVGKLLAEQGHEVYNPATSFGGRQDLPYDLYLRHALNMVTMVEGVVFLNKWEESRGALTEAHAGLSCGVTFFVLSRKDELVPYHLDYPLLTAWMSRKYLEDAIVPVNSNIPEVSGGHSRQTKSRKNHRNRSLAEKVSELDPTLLRTSA